MQRIALVVCVLALVFTVNCSPTNPALAQCRAVDCFTSAGRGYGDDDTHLPEEISHHEVTAKEILLRNLDPFTYIPFFNTEVDFFNKACDPELFAYNQSHNVPTLLAWTNGPLATYPAHFKAIDDAVANKKRKIWHEPQVVKLKKIAKPKVDNKKYARLIAKSKNAHGVDSHFYLAQAYLVAQNWDAAWRQGELIFKAEPDNDKLSKPMMDLYFDTPARYMEYCVWATRFLRVAKDWKSFESAYYKRSRMELNLAVAESHSTDQIWTDSPIYAAQSTIALYFRNTADGARTLLYDNIFQFCAKQIDQWAIASGLKFCFKIVDNDKDANITFEIKNPQHVCTTNVSPDHAPDGSFEPSPLAQTNYLSDKPEHPRSSIEFFIDSAPSYRDNELACICLHEVGHALGLRVHATANPDGVDIMHAYSSSLQKLSLKDSSRIKNLYKNVPVSLDAINQLGFKLNPW